MDNTSIEINKIKNNLVLLTNNLLCTFDVNQEISISNELQKEIENLLPLLNTKKNNPSLCQNSMNNFMNFPLPMMTPNFNINYNNNQSNDFYQKEMEKINQCMQYYAKEMSNIINVYFKKDKIGPFIIQGYKNEKVENLIERYRMTIFDMDKTEKFIFNSKPLLPDLTVAQAGLTNYSIIYIEQNKGQKEENSN